MADGAWWTAGHGLCSQLAGSSLELGGAFELVLDDALATALRGYRTAALKADGALRSAGDGLFGQLAAPAGSSGTPSNRRWTTRWPWPPRRYHTAALWPTGRCGPRGTTRRR